MTGPQLSIVIPCYDEEASIPVILESLTTLPILQDMEWEILLVDDGSTDATWSTIRASSVSCGELRGIRLAHNVGQMSALLAGLNEARGRAVITMDADLQHPPSLIPEMIRRWRDGKMMVATRRRGNEGESRLVGYFSRIFYRIFGRISGFRLQEGTADFRLMDRAVVDRVLALPPDFLFLRGFLEWMQPDEDPIEYEAPERAAGRPSYRFSQRVQLALSGLTSFSILPLRSAIAAGLLISLVSFAYLVYIVAIRIGGQSATPGWASVAGLLSLLIGVLFIYLGILGEYLGRVFLALRGLPSFSVTERTGRHSADPRLAEK